MDGGIFESFYQAFSWNYECERALRQLKDYLQAPPVLTVPDEGDVLKLYLAVSQHVVSTVLIKEEGKV